MSESDNDYFNVLRSYDGINFNKIGQIDGAGNSTSKISYEFEDYNVRSGKVYYRLEQVDMNGTATLSETVGLLREQTDGLGEIWPNPANSHLNVGLKPVFQGETVKIEILTAQGESLRNFELTLESEMTEVLFIDHLSSGTYFLKYISSTGQIQIKRFIKL